MNEQTLVSKVWNYAHVLRDEGVSYGDYVGQISFLLFLKMDEERTKYLGEPSADPQEVAMGHTRATNPARRWTRITRMRSKPLQEDGFCWHALPQGRRTRSMIRPSSNVSCRSSTERHGSASTSTLRATIYEGLLERNAGEVKSGAGQYFTPRALIQTIVEVVDPNPAKPSATRPAAPAAFCSPPMST